MNLKEISTDIHTKLFKHRHINISATFVNSKLSHEEKITSQSTLRHSWLFWCLIKSRLKKLSKKEFLTLHLCALMVIMENKLCKNKADYYLSSLWKNYLKEHKISWMFKSTWSFLLSLEPDFNTYRQEVLSTTIPELFIIQKVLQQESTLSLNALLSHPPLWCLVHDLNINLPSDASTKSSVELCSNPPIKSYRMQKTIKDQRLFDTGAISYQDIATQISCEVFLKAKKINDIHTIIDTCASPGGKTILLQKIWPKAHIYATDLNAKKVNSLQANIDRVLRDKKEIQCSIFNWEKDNWTETKEVDLLLCDLPCSGSGVLRKHPDILWSKSQNHFNQLLLTQKKILENASKVLKPRGILIIATCSILKEENEEQVQRLISRNDFSEIPFELSLGKKSSVGWTIFPTTNNDGVFYALLQKQ